MATTNDNYQQIIPEHYQEDRIFHNESQRRYSHLTVQNALKSDFAPIDRGSDELYDILAEPKKYLDGQSSLNDECLNRYRQRLSSRSSIYQSNIIK